MSEKVCAFTGSERCALAISEEHREQMGVLSATAERFKEFSEDLTTIAAQLKELVEQNREAQRELIDVLRGRAPSTYVPLSVYLLTIAVAIGVDKIEVIGKAITQWLAH